MGFDREGVLFPITPGTWKLLPQVKFSCRFAQGGFRPVVECDLSAMPEVWPQVSSMKQDPYGVIDITLTNGAVVTWGTPESEPIARKAQTLARVLDDAHNNMGGERRFALFRPGTHNSQTKR